MIRILHLEDSPVDAELVAEHLSRGGADCEITHVSSEADFRAALETGAFDVIICDYNMPGYDGLSALTLARERVPDTPVLLVSGSIGEEDAVRSLQAGASDYLLKDRLQRLIPAIDRAVADRRLARERQQAASDLRTAQERLKRLAESSDDVFWVVEGDAGQLVYLSPAFEDVWGISVDLALRDPDACLRAIHAADRTRVTRAFETFLAGADRRFEQAYRVVRPDGSVRHVLDRGTLACDDTGRVLGASGVARDITEMKQLEAQYTQSQKMEAVGRLAGTVAHDFNNLLTVILGFTELIEESLEASHPARADLSEVRAAAESATRLTKQLLAFSRRETVEPETLDVNALLREREEMWRRLVGEQITVVSEYGTVGPVRADRGHVEQVIMNLVVNARDAMPSGGRITIRTRAEMVGITGDGLPPGPYVVVSVADTGHGMTPEVQARILKPFFTTKASGEGTGLGLAAVYGLVKQAGGGIRVDSEPGRTVFDVYYPAVVPDQT